jgi:hypothetical protein
MPRDKDKADEAAEKAANSESKGTRQRVSRQRSYREPPRGDAVAAAKVARSIKLMNVSPRALWLPLRVL